MRGRRVGVSGPGWLALSLSHTRIAAGVYVEGRLSARLSGMGYERATQGVRGIRYVRESGDPVPRSFRLARPLHSLVHGVTSIACHIDRRGLSRLRANARLF